MSSEDRLFAAPVQSRMSLSCPALQQQPAPTPPLFSVVGGRLVQQPTRSASPFPLNGQQLQLQLDQLTSAMTDMMMEDDTMEVRS